MADSKDKKRKTLSLGDKTLSLKNPPAAPRGGEGGSKTVTVEVRRKRTSGNTPSKTSDRVLTEEERESRARALEKAAQHKKSETVGQTSFNVKKKEEEPKPEPEKEDSKEDARSREMAKMQKIKESEREKSEELERQRQADIAAQQAESQALDRKATGRKTSGFTADFEEENNEKAAKRKLAMPVKKRGGEKRRTSGNLTVNQAVNFDSTREERMPSMAAQRRAREKERMKANKGPIEHTKQVRDVVIPEAITVQELANRMAERVGDVVKKLMELGIMATATQTLDTDTAELVTQEFGHKVKRVSASDVEMGILGEEDSDADLSPRPPVVTIMGHVDHGKTSLLDALRQTDIAAGEAGGITQHIGAYQVTLEDGEKITFLDTPGHAAFTEMRARGADVTDIVVLVVAADDSIMPQTIEAINHAKAAKKPIIVAINKCDLPDADPEKVRTELLQHEIVVESMSGDVQAIDVSAHTKQGLKELEEAILLQSEILELKVNPNRNAIGAVVESKLEQGRGSVATVLIQKGTLKIGDIFVSGAESGRVRALINDKGKNIEQAIPGQPVEVLGLNGSPQAGDDFVVVENDSRAREIAEYRTKKRKDTEAAKLNRSGSLELFMSQVNQGEVKELPILIKGDVHGSVEAIIGAFEKLTEDNEEVRANILHSGVGGITESDITLANASNALIIGFNVRANAQARELAKREGVDIRYYSVIYNAIDDVKAMLSGLLAPEMKENFIGYAEIREVFNVSKVGKVAGCMVTNGVVKRGAKVRLLRDDVVIHEGKLKTLQRFKDEVKEVREGYECGMAFDNYDDIKQGDVIECFEIQEIAREI
ncbi:MAG: translation initiation factor IF-2 [Pseudomonadota bacterium]